MFSKNLYSDLSLYPGKKKILFFRSLLLVLEDQNLIFPFQDPAFLISKNSSIIRCPD